MAPTLLDRRRLRASFLRWPLRARLGAAAGVVLVLAVVAILVLRANALRGLPDVGDPFDVDAFLKVDVPNERNAFNEYGRALPMKIRLRGDVETTKQLNEAVAGEWSTVPESLREWLEENRESLALWRKGTDKPDAMAVAPAQLATLSGLRIAGDFREFAFLALLEGSRLEAEGDMRGAWGWYRATLRSGRHLARQYLLVERRFGEVVHKLAADRLTRWAADPRVDARLLREALREVVAIDAMTPPPSDWFKLEYLHWKAALDSPNLPPTPEEFANRPIQYGRGLWAWAPWLVRGQGRARVAARAEPERSKRVLKLIFANWLASCDLPASRRPRVVDGTLLLFEPDPSAPPAARALEPAEMVRWYESTIYARAIFDGINWRAVALAVADRERETQAELVRTLKEQLRRREGKGRAPEAAVPSR